MPEPVDLAARGVTDPDVLADNDTPIAELEQRLHSETVAHAHRTARC